MTTKKRKQWDKRNMENAIKAKLNNEMGYLKAHEECAGAKGKNQYVCDLCIDG